MTQTERFGLGRDGVKYEILIYSESRMNRISCRSRWWGVREGEKPWKTVGILAFTTDRMDLPFPEWER